MLLKIYRVLSMLTMIGMFIIIIWQQQKLNKAFDVIDHIFTALQVCARNS